ncbi:potassium channel subfamily K member 15-like [Dendronephthya gigantea]|uniref:potassium channel subfamily K member 15-like n=1 Tax=Dendronephthya gigantea TaxID=151771 RepID=UPI00106B9594|nr:potassium channel subfamily K member 15-like [Dendronephthya gigantea]
MTRILVRSISNISDIQLIMAEIRITFFQESFPVEWDFLGGVNISVQAITTIGYGNTVPRTTGGRMFLIVYATVGIPLMAMMLTTFGDRLRYIIRSCILSFERKALKITRPQNIQKKSLIAVFVITILFLCLISAISGIIQDWNFSLALYVWFVTFTTIGFGDYVPKGTNKLQAIGIVFALISFTLGLTLIATILHALSDWVNTKKPPTKESLKRSLGRLTKRKNLKSSSHQKEESFTDLSEVKQEKTTIEAEIT